MADMTDTTGAADDLAAPKTDSAKSFFIEPEDVPEGMDGKAGDVLEFQVVGRDKEGRIELQYNAGEGDEGEGMAKDLRSAYASPPAETPTE